MRDGVMVIDLDSSNAVSDRLRVVTKVSTEAHGSLYILVVFVSGWLILLELVYFNL